MKCIIVDPNSGFRNELKKKIKELPNLQFVEEFETINSAKDFLKKNKGEVDLMFLEQKFTGKETGLGFLKNLDNPPMSIIITEDPSHAIEAFELNVIDYVLKPLNLSRFIKAVLKAEEALKGNKQNESTDLDKDDFIFIKSERKYIKIKIKDLLFVEGLKDYVIVHATHGKYMTAMNVKTIHNKLSEKIFFRVSKSYIININYIDNIDGGFININDEKVPIGRSYRDIFMGFVHSKLLRR